jgi:hypothetical protein
LHLEVAHEQLSTDCDGRKGRTPLHSAAPGDFQKLASLVGWR